MSQRQDAYASGAQHLSWSCSPTSETVKDLKKLLDDTEGLRCGFGSLAWIVCAFLRCRTDVFLVSSNIKPNLLDWKTKHGQQMLFHGHAQFHDAEEDCS